MISTERRWDALGLRPSAKRYLLLALVLPATVISAAYASLWISGLAPFRFVDGFSALGRLGYEWTIGFALAFFGALVEELVWRGFVVSWVVKRFDPVAVVWLTWVGWFSCRLPVVLFQDHPLSIVVQLAVVGTLLFALNIILTWLRLRSNSVWPCIVFHGAHSFLILGIFDLLTDKTGTGSWLAGQSGVALAGAYLAIAVPFFWALATSRVPSAPDRERGHTNPPSLSGSRTSQ
jgi:uncharacterized protein